MKSLIRQPRRNAFIFRSSGVIDISASVARSLSIYEGDVIDIAEQDGELYMYIKHKRNEYCGRYIGTAKASNNGKGTYRVYSKQMAQEVLRISHSASKLKCPAGELVNIEGRMCVTIIYRINNEH